MTVVGKKAPKTGDALPVAQPTGIKLPVEDDGADEIVPDTHPIADPFPEQFTIPVKLRRVSLEVHETFEREKKLGPLNRRRMLRATYQTYDDSEFGLARDCVEIVADVEIRGFEFGPDGTPTDVARWSAVVAEGMATLRDEASRRVQELIEAGLEAEESEAAK